MSGFLIYPTATRQFLDFDMGERNTRYFDGEATENLMVEIESWLGVKYRHLGVNRAGVDCAYFCGNIYRNLGIITQLEKIYYAPDWYLHGSREILVENVQRHFEKFIAPGLTVRFEPCGSGHIPGDMILYRLYSDNVPYHHTAVVIAPGKIAHALERTGVHVSDLRQWRNKTQKIVRVYK